MRGGEKREQTCCFTGHRPEGLPWGRDETSAGFFKLRKALLAQVENTIELGYRFFLTGMAEGIDLLAADVVLELQKIYPQVELECVIPYLNHGNRLKGRALHQYERVLQLSNKRTVVSKEGSVQALMKRNRYMVDHSSRLIAVYNGSRRGGTKATLLYAARAGIDICTISLAPYFEEAQMTFF